ncbi:amino acid ABC transporter permease [Leucobacter sp. CSA1]|uniref:Amino acid ABC transporter permease n=1 Tax=Leucobacter chromiisoli TaxID=2796471 RepID=A0A934Q774_9MICO|nr:amino acid ABC transporter permease [Leucobacter chromiisoli]MBK0419565.1 amino acid ABC transporter permease [Leucobacter chromiisoli]
MSDRRARREYSAAELELLKAGPPRRHLGVVAGVLALCVLLAGVIYSLWTNSRFEWEVVWGWFASEKLFTGLLATLWLTVVAMLIGLVLGVLVAVMNMSKNPFFKTVAQAYLWVFRGTPVFVQLLFWGFIAALYPRIEFGIPFLDPWVSLDANVVITPFVAAILGLGLNEAAYMAEIVRSGLLSVDKGQTEAASALGMRPGNVFFKIVLPQAMRIIVPTTGNETINMLKTTSLVSVLAFPDLLYSAQLVYSANYKTIPLLISASLWYLIVTSILSAIQWLIERHFNRGHTGRAQQGAPVVDAEQEPGELTASIVVPQRGGGLR